ncbi:MAG: hypothetical protein JWL76_143 [Thermoleophilia bacterium]|nr:hypothetical protein [Thermoleophilia bacterium]
MNLASIAAVPTVASQLTSVPVAPARVTETELAKQHLTPQSRKLLPDALLDAKVGRSTLAGSLNDQIRFRVQRDGQVANWKIVPDSPTAAALAQSKAGPELLRQLTTAVRSTGTLEEVSNLKGFILAEDDESVLSGRVLSWLDDPADPDGKQLARLGELNRTKVAGRIMRKWGDGLDQNIAKAGAWNSRGWITFMPDTSRAMLVNSGAYDPHRSREKSLLGAKSWTDYLSGNAPHEVQHSVSGPSPTAYQGAAKWMEEGTANVFSRTPTFQAKNRIAANLKPEVYAARLSHEPSFETGWDVYKRPALAKEKQKDYDKETSRNYGDSQVVLRDLVRLAGGDFRSSAGKALAFELLQHKSMRFTPGVLATAIIEHNDLEPKVYDRLRERIKNAVDVKGGAAAIAKEFGIA